MRVAGQAAFRVGDPHLLQRLDGTAFRLGPADLEVVPHRRRQDPADGQHRVQRCHRILEHHGDLPAAHRADLLAAQADQVLPAVDHPALHDRPRRQQPQQRQCRHGLAAATLAGDAEHLALVDLEVDSVHDGDQPARPGSRTRSPSTSSNGVIDARSPRPQLLRGSIASRRLSPRKLNASTSEKMARPGECGDPPRLEVQRSGGHHRSPLRDRRLRAETEEGQAGQQQHGVADVEGGQHQHRPEDVGQHVLAQRPPRRGAEQPHRLHVVRPPGGQHQPADDPGIGRPGDESQCQHRVLQAGPEHRRHHHGQHDRREGEERRRRCA